jgi:serine/threonine-protein kinase
MPTDPHHRAGERVGRWELVTCIGVGGMGSVWEARHESLRRRVAIKFIHASHASDAEARVRFTNEARAASALQSRHAVEMFDHGVSERGEPFIVMEFLVGESLEQWLRSRGTLSLALTSTIITHVARALQQAHDLGIVHRDLKPENVFLSPDEEPGAFVAKVLDFGVVKVSGADAALLDPMTQTGTLLGTPYYMAPEQARGSRAIDGRADLWSLGVVAYRCVTGALPFDGDALGELLVRICTGVYDAPSTRRAELPPAFDTWMARALGVEPRQRFATATELAEALAEIVSAHGSLERTFDRQLSQRPRAVSPSAPMTQPLGVFRPRSEGSVGAFAATQQSIPPSGPGSVRVPPSTRISAPPPVRAQRQRLAALGAAALVVATAGAALLRRGTKAAEVEPAPSASDGTAQRPTIVAPIPAPEPAIPSDVPAILPPADAGAAAPSSDARAPFGSPPRAPTPRRAPNGGSSADPGF